MKLCTCNWNKVSLDFVYVSLIKKIRKPRGNWMTPTYASIIESIKKREYAGDWREK